MRQPMMNVESGVNVVLMVDGNAVGGQLNVSMGRSANPIDITNKIKAEWKEQLIGLKTWTITCDGLYVKDEPGLRALENAFMENKEVEVIVKTSDRQYFGKAIILNFPVSANYSTAFKYNIQLVGNGPLE